VLESKVLVSMTAETGSKHEATRGDTTFLPNSPHKRSKDPAAKASSARRRGGRLRVLMANEPRAYREGIAAVISQLRPEVEIETVEPETLDPAIGRFSPDMVICSKNASLSVASIGGRRVEYAEIQLPDLLSIVDKAEELAQ
jgi:hypothetical protein